MRNTDICERLDYSTLNKPQKRQVIKFVRKVYECSQINVKDIITNTYQAILKDNRLVGVSYKL